LQQQLALLAQRLAVAGEVLEGRRLHADHPAVEEAPAGGGGARHHLHLGGAPGDDRQHRQVLGQARRLAVDRPDPLLAEQADGERRAAVALDLAQELEGGGTVTGAVTELRGAEAPGGGEGVDRLEQAGLAGAVAAQQQVRAGARLPGQVLEVAEAAGFEAEEQRGLPRGRPPALEWRAVRSSSA
jgi:hypothetical protein